MRNIILVDIDHTISDAFWRDELIKRSRDSGDWHDYHSRGKEDKPLADVKMLLQVLILGCKEHYEATDLEVWGITARPEKWRKQTMDWFVKNEIDLDVILMRPEDAFKPAPQIKIDLCNENRIMDKILCIFDDREDVISAFRELGITAFHVYARKGETK